MIIGALGTICRSDHRRIRNNRSGPGCRPGDLEAPFSSRNVANRFEKDKQPARHLLPPSSSVGVSSDKTLRDYESNVALGNK